MNNQTMPKALKKKWIADLRANPDKQGRDALRDGDNKFCCLGRLMMVADGHVRAKVRDGQYPSLNFAKKHGISGTANDERLNFVLEIGGSRLTASQHNDGGRTFAEIADAIERDVEGV
jgi:hypothetical protein